jgi:hypothetical protein
MRTKSAVLIVASALWLACSSHTTAGLVPPSGDTGSAGPGSSGGGLADDGGTGSGGGASNGSAAPAGSVPSSGGPFDGGQGSAPSDGGGGLAADSGIPESDFGQTITLTATPFVVPAGAEVYKCQKFANPFGAATDILWMHGVMSAGSHHFFLLNLDPVIGALYTSTLEDCPAQGLDLHPFPFLSQQPDWTVQFPVDSDGSPMGYPVAAANSLTMSVHYLNATGSDLTANASITIKTAKPGVVKTHVGNLFLNNSTLSVPVTPVSNPVAESLTWNGDYSLPATYSLFSSWSHMHRWGLDFTTTTNGQTIYSTSNWDTPPIFFHNPVIPMTSSQSMTWTCNYYNDTGATLTFGDSAVKNVMCIYIGQYYPADATNPDIIYIAN